MKESMLAQRDSETYNSAENYLFAVQDNAQSPTTHPSAIYIIRIKMTSI
jgi:hypothetical protein